MFGCRRGRRRKLGGRAGVVGRCAGSLNGQLIQSQTKTQWYNGSSLCSDTLSDPHEIEAHERPGNGYLIPLKFGFFDIVTLISMLQTSQLQV